VKDYREVTTDDILETDRLTITITKKEVIKNDIKKLSHIFNLMKKCKKRGKQKLIIHFSGFESTDKEIFEIQEIRDYIKKVFNKYPYMFYFLSNIENNNRLILACLCRVDVIKEQEVNEFFKDGSKIKILFDIPIGVKTKIKNETRNFALTIGEKEKQIKKFIKKFFKDIPDMDEVYTPKDVFEMKRLIENYNKTNKKLWLGFINDLGIKHFVKEEEIEDFIKVYKPYIDMCIKTKRYSTPIMVKLDTPSNIFVVSDASFGEICAECGATTILVIKNALEDEIEALRGKIFLPSPQNYISKRIAPNSKAFLTQIPVPIDPKKDKWFCVKCKEVHSFNYNENLELIF
jgi:hypothetical protein